MLGFDKQSEASTMTQPSRIYNASLVIDAKPRLKRLSCGLINPERRAIYKLLASGCVVTGSTWVTRNKLRLYYDQRL